MLNILKNFDSAEKGERPSAGKDAANDMKTILESFNKVSEASVEECGGMPMAAPQMAQQQGTPVSMNVSLNASGKDNVDELMALLKGAGLGDNAPVSMGPKEPMDMGAMRALVMSPDAEEDEGDMDEEWDNSVNEGGFFDPDQPNPGDMVKHRNGAVGKVKKIGTQGDETWVYFKDNATGEMNFGQWKKQVFPAKKTESLNDTVVEAPRPTKMRFPGERFSKEVNTQDFELSSMYDHRSIDQLYQSLNVANNAIQKVTLKIEKLQDAGKRPVKTQQALEVLIRKRDYISDLIDQKEMQGEGVAEEWDNSPDEEYSDYETMTQDLSGGINRQKKHYKKAQDGDNAMAAESIKAQLWAALNEKKATEGKYKLDAQRKAIHANKDKMKK